MLTCKGHRHRHRHNHSKPTTTITPPPPSNQPFVIHRLPETLNVVLRVMESCSPSKGQRHRRRRQNSGNSVDASAGLDQELGAGYLRAA